MAKIRFKNSSEADFVDRIVYFERAYEEVLPSVFNEKYRHVTADFFSV